MKMLKLPLDSNELSNRRLYTYEGVGSWLPFLQFHILSWVLGNEKKFSPVSIINTSY